MNFTYENQGSNTYMVYQVGNEDVIDSMSLGMITNNKILGLAPTVFFQQDNTKYFKYNISAKVSANQFLMGTVNKKRLVGIFKGIINAMLSAEEYMIDTNSICLDLQYIYTDVSTCETILICLPIVDLEKSTVDLKTFFKNIVFSTQFDQTENCDYIAKLFNYLNSATVFSLTDFKELLDSIERDGYFVQQPVTPVPQSGTISQPVMHQQDQRIQQEIQTTVRPQQPAPQVISKPVEEQVEKSFFSQDSSAGKKEMPDMGFAIPGQSAGNGTANKSASFEKVPEAANEKEISWFYLMQHYNKENAALYKAQKEAKKAAKATEALAKKDKKNKKDKKETDTGSDVMNQAFAIPGQPVEQPKPMDIANTQQQVIRNVIPQQPQNMQQQMSQQPQNMQQQMSQQSQMMHQQMPHQSQMMPQQPQTIHQTSMGGTVNFGETTILSASVGETTVLSANVIATEVHPYLIRSKNNEKIFVDKPIFRIGKEKSYVDYFIGDNTAISRGHAHIITRDGEYFIMDTNSTNHTYINGAMIQSNVEAKLSNGDKVRLANEDFEFRIY